MKTQNKLFAILLVLTFILSACGGGTSTDTMDTHEDTMMETPTEEGLMPAHRARGGGIPDGSD